MSPFFKLFTLENLGMVIRNMVRVGPITTIRYVFSDMFFDMRYQIETVNTVKLDELRIDSPNKGHATYYEGTNSFVFKKVMSRLKLDYVQCGFIDFGSGKGKALFLAGEMGFHKVIGVEFSQDLVDICNKNYEMYRKRSKSKTEFKIIHVDASEFMIPPEYNVMYFANPFNELITRKVIENIIRSYENHPRTIWAIYLYPKQNKAFAYYPVFRQEFETQEGVVYRLG